MMPPFDAWPAQVGQIKVVSFLHKRADLELSQFSQHWRTTHRAHAQTLLRAGYLNGYVQTHRCPEFNLCQSQYDGSPEIWVEHIDALNQLSSSREYLEGAAQDEPNFIQLPVLSSVMQVTQVTRTPQTLGSAAPYKLMLAIAPPAHMSFSDFSQNWQQLAQGCLFNPQPPLACVRHLAVAELLEHSPFWAVESSWWPSLSALQAAWAVQKFPSWLHPEQLSALIGQELWVQQFPRK